jgi:release factor glutamine methyltransferase
VTILDALRRATARLRAAGVDSPEHDAEVLLRHVLGWDRARLLAEGTSALGSGEGSRYLSLVEERARRRPLQHLTGLQWFWGREISVSPEVLIPRPETEVLVEAALAAIRAVEGPVVVDVGTGSGCVALAVASEREDAEVHAVDVSRTALAVARSNAERLGLAERLVLHHGDLLDPLAPLAGRIDLVVSNPPYVSTEEHAALAPEVAVHEPRLALVPPAGNRLSVYRRLAPAAARLLRPGGIIAVEIGQGMADEVSRELSSAGLEIHRVVPDLAGIDRVVIARRSIG